MRRIQQTFVHTSEIQLYHQKVFTKTSNIWYNNYVGGTKCTSTFFANFSESIDRIFDL